MKNERGADRVNPQRQRQGVEIEESREKRRERERPCPTAGADGRQAWAACHGQNEGPSKPEVLEPKGLGPIPGT